MAVTRQYHLLRDGKRNVSGLVSFFFVEARYLLQDPRPLFGARGLVVDELPLSSAAQWYQGIVTSYTLNYAENRQQRRTGEYYQQQIDGVIARQSPELQEVLSAMRRRRYVVITRDRNNYLKLIGSRECPLEFSYRSQTGSSPRERNQVSFRFQGDTRNSSLFVHGNLYDYIAQVEQPDLGDTTVAAQRVLDQHTTIRILSS